MATLINQYHNKCGGEIECGPRGPIGYGPVAYTCRKCNKTWPAYSDDATGSMSKTVLFWTSDPVMGTRHVKLGFPYEADGEERLKV